MGDVYAARRVHLGDVVALKRLLPDQDTEENRRRFTTEARAAAHIRHPNVVRVFDFGDIAGETPYIVMEYLEGPTLAEELATLDRLPSDRALWVFAQICAAVEAGHRRGIVHRDLKPANVILAASDDGTEVAKVLDFGVALDRRVADQRLTSPGTILGTCAYMAPEQVESGVAFPATDVFSLGVMLYEMVTGALPFEGESSLATLIAITKGEYRPARDLDEAIAPAIATAIDAALRRDPEQRPQSPEQLARMAGVAAPTPGAIAPGRRPAGAPSTSIPVTPTRTRRDEDATTSLDADTLLGFGGFVGRATELARLRGEYLAASSGAGRLALVIGEAGLGASRLVEQFVRWAKGAGAAILAGRFFDYAGSRPPPLETFWDMLAPARPGMTTASISVESGRWEAFAAVTDAIAGAAGGRPLVIAFDNLQWATRLDLELIDHLSRALGRRGTLIVATMSRDAEGEVVTWRSRRGADAELVLAPFDEGEVRTWLDQVFGGLRIAPPDVRHLMRTTGGNPHTLVEVTRHLLARGLVVQDEDGWACASLAGADLPESVTSAIAARLAELAPDVRHVLEVAAVIGDELRVDTLAAAAGVDESAIDAALDVAVGKRFVSERGVSPGNDLRFARTLVREVLYEAMPARRRRRVHQAVVEAIERIHAAELDRISHVLAYHHHAVGNWAAALRHGLRAGEMAMARHDHDTAAAALRRAEEAVLRADAEGIAIAAARSDETGELALTPPGGNPIKALAATPPTGLPSSITARAALGATWPSQHVPTPDPHGAATGAGGGAVSIDRVLLDRFTGALAAMHGRHADAVPRLERAAAGAGAAGRADIRVDALLELARSELARGSHAAASEVAATAAAEATAAGDRLRAVKARLLAVEVMLRTGADPGPELDQLLAATTDADPRSLRARILRHRGWRNMKQGAWAPALVDAEESVMLARASGDLVAQESAVALVAAIRAESGDPAAAITPMRQALELARRLADRRREGIDLANLGEVLLELGRTDEALDHMRAGLAVFVEIGDRACEGDCRVNIGRTLLAAGDRPAAIAMLERGSELCAATSRREYAGIALLHLGDAHLADADPIAARSAYTGAADTFAAIANHLRWKAELGVARAARATNDPAEASKRAATALALIEEQRKLLPPGADASHFARAQEQAESLLT